MKKIAIIGTGISGLTCGYLLSRQHDIQVFEANDYIGGHTATKTIEHDGRQYNIDTGFIVFNDWTYDNFNKLINQIGVPSQPTQMSFSVKNQQTGLEYNGHTLNTLFAQRQNLVNPKFLRMLNEIVDFNKRCKRCLHVSLPNELTLETFIDMNGYSEMFKTNYILPMCAAIWSASLNQAGQFPFAFFLKFFNNHGLLNITDRPQWSVIQGGSKEYIPALTEPFRDRIHLSSPVCQVTAHQGKYEVETENGQRDLFDEVIFACHSDQALKLIRSPDEATRSILGAIQYAENDVVLHTDTSVLPSNQLAWASWNYLLKDPALEKDKPASVTYNMNILQSIDSDTTFCVTLNNVADIDNEKIIQRLRYAHPQFSPEMVAAQSQRHEICGVNGLHFCGAYWYNGFHEDGVRSALDICERFGAKL